MADRQRRALMKVPLSWLEEFIELPTRDPGEIESALAQLGHEVDEIARLEASFEGVVVGRVEEVGPHPNADRIRFCRVSDGSAVHDVVCGAWNFEAGAIIAYAKVGSRLGLDTDSPFELTAKELRGVTSNGMIASAAELGLGHDHDGILVLNMLGLATENDLGRDLADLLPYPDLVFDITITPNRGDCMSMVGLARELAAFWDITIREPEVDLRTSGAQTGFAVDVEDREACPRFAAREVADIEVGPSPLWMQMRLAAAGQRPISNVVDVSNYVMLEIGHPIHTFDADKIDGERLVIRRAKDGERLRTLDGQDRRLDEGDIVVSGQHEVLALAGVMGGESTEVSDSTTRVLIEAAHWDPASVILTSHRLGLRSEASSRFERGVDPNLSDLATARAAELIAGTARGSVKPGLVDVYPQPITPWIVELSATQIARLLGPEPDLGESADYLRRLGFGVDRVGDDLVAIEVPTRRPDVTRAADAVEEIARMHGYDSFADRLRRGNNGSLTRRQQAGRKLAAVMVGAGFSEAQTLSFIGQSDLDRLRLPAEDHRRIGITVNNPLREEEGTMRTTLIPGLLKALGTNLGRAANDVALFETGSVFLRSPDRDDPRIPYQPNMLSFVALGSMGAPGMNGSARPVDVYAATGVVDLIGESFGFALNVTQEQTAMLHPGRSARVDLAGVPIGFVGELHPAIARDFGLTGRLIVGELETAMLLAPQDDWAIVEVSEFPPAAFDLAFELAESVSAGSLLETVERSAGASLENVEVFDEFRGTSIGGGRKSLAVRLSLRAIDGTLTDEELVPIRGAIVAAVSEQLGGTLRGPE